MGQQNSHVTVLPQSMLDCLGHKVKVIGLQPSPLADQLLSQAKKYLLRLHHDCLELVSREADSAVVCRVSFYHICYLMQFGCYITIGVGRKSCFGPGEMQLQCRKVASCRVISTSFLGRYQQLHCGSSTVNSPETPPLRWAEPQLIQRTPASVILNRRHRPPPPLPTPCSPLNSPSTTVGDDLNLDMTVLLSPNASSIEAGGSSRQQRGSSVAGYLPMANLSAPEAIEDDCDYVRPIAGRTQEQQIKQVQHQHNIFYSY